VHVTDESLEKETQIVSARNQAEDLQDEVARLKEWQKPELRTNSAAKVNILTLSFKSREDVIGNSRTFVFANQQSQDVTQFGYLNCLMTHTPFLCGQSVQRSGVSIVVVVVVVLVLSKTNFKHSSIGVHPDVRVNVLSIVATGVEKHNGAL
jgi:hypothetical protein